MWLLGPGLSKDLQPPLPKKTAAATPDLSRDNVVPLKEHP
ncbi:UNVERIFIED_ORG: hypothetical protein J2X79_001536 [Arthrobacter globiformis]|nr:hypothetical protein [Arthrobacter globiformis]